MYHGKLGSFLLGLAAAIAVPALLSGGAWAETPEEIRARLADPRLSRYVVGDQYSGYVWATDQTRAMQDDDDKNPGFMWVDRARVLWSTVDGAAGRSCASCHGDVEQSMLGVATRYPRWSEARGKPITVERQINICRAAGMKASEWKYESEELLGMTALVRLQSRGMPLDVSIDGPMKAWYDKGREFYTTRRGLLDFSCKHCHDDHPGQKLRSETLSQGQVNGFPTYRLKWQGLGSLHRRFVGCNQDVRSEPYPLGSDEYVALEVFLTGRGRGLPIETPSVRK
ncbi:MAG: sulfur oxidation c-type cytochrome SoxA [Alphaproteobacteria bacterium]